MNRDIQDIKRDLTHVYWLGGSSCAGKTTISERFENQLGFSLYHTDSKWWTDHMQSAEPDCHPGMVAYREFTSSTQSIQEWFDTIPVADLVELQIKFFTEEFEMIIDDLYELPRDQPILAEGSALSPSQVSSVTEPHQALWLISTESFERNIRQQRFEGNPDIEIGPWFDNMITWSSKRKKRTISQAEHLGLKVIETDGNRSIQDTFDMIRSHFKLETNNP